MSIAFCMSFSRSACPWARISRHFCFIRSYIPFHHRLGSRARHLYFIIHIALYMSFHVHCILYVILSVCVPVGTHFEAFHFIALCMLGCILVAFHAYHAYCIVFGIGVSPGTGNEVHSVLRVTECVSIPRSPTLRITHDGVRFSL
ncbi:hypothetical protein LOK49_LG07G01020 [Camellia lanceoleosa]|uniref:Uncharacterized protein n=1 Tax=Camellia lanceoleosa TaxID=1840588 RepID=A0ACC0H3R4_9ERIC|nr:hypothetical protein LOK49_LG07G01020 [Camellia lanceoleosa]